MTERQLMLFFREAIRHEQRARADRIQDVNVGTAGGKHATDLIKALTQDL